MKLPDFHTCRTAAIAAAIALSCLVAPGLKAAPTVSLDRMAVIVNDDVITEQDLQHRIRIITSQFRGRGAQLPSAEVLRKQVLENMILERIQLQMAAAAGINVREQQVTEALAEAARQNRMSTEKLKQVLVRDGIPLEEFREQLRGQVAIRALLGREIHSQIHITDYDVDAFLQERAQRGGNDVQYQLSHILIAVAENASPTERRKAEKLARRVKRQLDKGASFTKLAVAHSRDQYALKGGEIGWRTLGQLPSLFAEPVSRLTPGKVSQVIQSPNGYHLIRLNKKRGSTKKTHTVTQTLARHILLKRGGISDSYLKRELERLRQRIVNGDDFGKIAQVHSDDSASAANGGSLDWVTPGQMVPSFEKAMNKLKPGEISPVVESPYGFHIIQVLKRRKKDIGKEKERADARRELHMRKFDERLQEWLRRLRDQAYVEYLG